jgi:hypothetical protein
VNIILIGALGFLAYKMYEQSNVLSNALQYTFTGLKFLKKRDSSLQFLGFQTTLKLTNNTNISANLNGVNGVAYYITGSNKYPIGGYTIANKFTIPANATTSVPMLINLSNVETGKAILATIATLRIPTLELTGTISTTVGNIPFTYTLKA